MSALPATATRAVNPPRTKPCAKKDPKVAREFVDRLRDVYCPWRGRYCVWAGNDCLRRKFGLTEHQLRHRLRTAEEQGLIVRYGSHDEFKRWLETTGAPNLGLDPAGPPNMVRPDRVIVLTELLPPAPPSLVYGPLRLPVDDPPPGDIAPPPPGDIAPPLPIGVLIRGVETVETYVTNVSAHADGTKTPIPSAEEAWAALPAEERDRREAAVLMETPGLAKWPNMLRLAAVEALGRELGSPTRPATPSPAISGPMSQGLPRRGSQGVPGAAPGGSARIGVPTLPPVGLKRVEDALAFMRDAVAPADRDVDRMAAADMAGGLIACALNDSGDASEAYWSARVRECVLGRLSTACLVDAVRGACATDVINSGAWAVAYLKRHRGSYAVRFETPTAGSPGKVTPAVGSRPYPTRSETGR